MTEATQQDARKNEALWRKTLITGHPSKIWGRKLMRLLPGPPRCKVCHNPFGGIGGHICGAIGMKPSRKNPRLCALCCEKMPPGGAEVEIAVLFADVRGSTALAERLGTSEYTKLISRFNAVASDTVIRWDGLIDKFVGDAVVALFVPGFAGEGHAAAAVSAAMDLLKATGNAEGSDPWLPTGIGVHTGTAYVGVVGPQYGAADITAMGDAMNVTARLADKANAGEALVSQATLERAGSTSLALERKSVSLKGISRPVQVGVCRG